VRVIAGSPASPIAGTDVTLTVNTVPRVARTDEAGRAIFKICPRARPCRRRSPTRTSRSTRPTSSRCRRIRRARADLDQAVPAGGGGAPFAGGGGAAGMPNPRQVSGEPRAEANDPAGTYTVRVAYDDFKDTPSGIVVALVVIAATITSPSRSSRPTRTGARGSPGSIARARPLTTR